MIINYVSPSTIPSTSANSVHVMMQCQALNNIGVGVTLFAERSIKKADSLLDAIQGRYNVSLDNTRIITNYNFISRASSLQILARALSENHKNKKLEHIITRNLYAAYVLAVIYKKPLIYETHQLEFGIRKHLQKAIINSSIVRTVVISKKLQSLLKAHLHLNNFDAEILHDAAPAQLIPAAKPIDRSRLLSRFSIQSTKYTGICGYFGHLYPGRGIEIIESLAEIFPDKLFLVVGGNKADVATRKKLNYQNICYAGHLAHAEVQQLMREVDVLLMPYQKSVSIGIKGHDTARWMSPMKMFEYMASGVPVISSDLPVLREVLADGKNALLVPPDSVTEWSNAIRTIFSRKDLSATIASAAYADYKNHYTWDKRAERLVDLILSL